MQRMSVDLPEPEGPQMTIFSPCRTRSDTSFKAWKSPNHLCTPDNSMAGRPLAAAALTSALGMRPLQTASRASSPPPR